MSENATIQKVHVNDIEIAYKVFGEVISAYDLVDPSAVGQPGAKLVYNDAGHWLRDIVADRIRVQGEIRPVVENRIGKILSP